MTSQQAADDELDRRRREEQEVARRYEAGELAAYKVDRDPEDELPAEAQGQRWAGEESQDPNDY